MDPLTSKSSGGRAFPFLKELPPICRVRRVLRRVNENIWHTASAECANLRDHLVVSEVLAERPVTGEKDGGIARHRQSKNVRVVRPPNGSAGNPVANRLDGSGIDINSTSTIIVVHELFPGVAVPV